MAAAAVQSSWSDLPADLISEVLLRLPSLGDLVRLRAVCRPWLAAGARPQHQIPPPSPWFAHHAGTLFDNHGAPVRICSTPILRHGVSDYLAVDNLAFLVRNHGGEGGGAGRGICSLVNPISQSAEETPLPDLAEAVLRAMKDSNSFTPDNITMPYAKVIMSSPLDSSDPFVAALILEGYYVAISAFKRHDVIGFGSVPWDEIYMNIPGKGSKMYLVDIAFSNGWLYTLTVNEGLYVFGSDSVFHQCIVDDIDQRQIYTKPYYSDDDYLVLRYLVDCNGRLFLMRRWMGFSWNAELGGDVARTCRFEVFEADLTTIPCQWRKVDGLGGQAIFVDHKCAKFVRASKCVGGVQEDCIYFMNRFYANPCREYSGLSIDPLADSGVYNMRNGEITPLLPEAATAKLRLQHQYLSWFFPAHV
uniref:Uncharacterized protein n=1 Tax=Leersia perrieri TaxID=77586 RepID=A0A0D9Y138_9ORYZ